MSMIMASYKVFFLLFISCNVCYDLYPLHQSEAASVPSASTTGSHGKGGISSRTIVAIVVLISVAVLIFIVAICCLSKRRRKKRDSAPEENSASDFSTLVSLQYDFSTIEAATNKFSSDNKIGEVAFGVVYKGTLANGQDIAVKRLSRGSKEGAQEFKDEEFKNEVEALAKIQHRNIVKFLGFSVQGEEKILVYEYLPNRSLNYSLFDLEKQRQLDWTMRYEIIKGIAQGIQYLHEDATIKIIHRDLKVSSILLDDFLNPKITDFSLATIFPIDQTQGNTDRLYGTIGYVSPEYAMYGDFSVKSDVFSFGIILMEIISGKKNSCFYQTEGVEDLLSHVITNNIWTHFWKLWKEGEPLELLDPTIRESCIPNEVIRCIHISLLCVQEDPADRPFMASIVLMLDNCSLTLPTPTPPTYFAQEDEMSGGEVISQ